VSRWTREPEHVERGVEGGEFVAVEKAEKAGVDIAVGGVGFERFARGTVTTEHQGDVGSIDRRHEIGKLFLEAVTAGVSHEWALLGEIVALAERCSIGRREPIDVDPVGNHGYGPDTTGFERRFSRVARRDYPVGTVEKPPLVGVARARNTVHQPPLREIAGVLRGRRVIRRHEGPIGPAGEPEAGETDPERGVSVDDIRVTNVVRYRRRTDPVAIVERKGDASNRILARPALVIAVGIDHVHPAVPLGPVLAPRLDGVRDAVHRRKVGVGERGDMWWHRSAIQARRIKPL